MLSIEQVKDLKQANVSVDAEKTMQRFKEDFSSATAKVKQAIVELSGQTRTSLYRVYRTGVINARIAVAIAQELNVSPLYYTGEIDEKAPCVDRIVQAFAERYTKTKPMVKAEPAPKKGAKKAVATPKKRAKKVVAAPMEEEPVAVPVAEEPIAVPEVQETAPQSEAAIAQPDDADDFVITLSNSEAMQQALAKMDEESAVLLLKSLFLRAEAGGLAEKLADTVKRCLLT